MIANVETLVGGVNKDGVISEAFVFECLAEAGEIFIHPLNAAEVILGVALEFPANEIASGEIGLTEGLVFGAVGGAPDFELLGRHALHVHVCRAIFAGPTLLGDFEIGSEIREEVVIEIHVTIDFHLLMLGGNAALVLVEESIGLGDLDIVVEVEVAEGGHPGAVRRLVLTHQHEGLTESFGFFHEIDGHVGNNVGAVSRNNLATLGGDQSRIVVIALPGKNSPGIEALWVSFEVGLSVECRVVTGSAENFREDLLIPVEAIPIVHEAVFMAVLAAHDDSAGRSANRVGAEGIFEEHPVSRELVDFRSRIHRLKPTVVCPDGVRCVIVGEEENDVWFLRVTERSERQEEQGKQLHAAKLKKRE